MGQAVLDADAFAQTFAPARRPGQRAKPLLEKLVVADLHLPPARRAGRASVTEHTSAQEGEQPTRPPQPAKQHFFLLGGRRAALPVFDRHAIPASIPSCEPADPRRFPTGLSRWFAYDLCQAVREVCKANCPQRRRFLKNSRPRLYDLLVL